MKRLILAFFFCLLAASFAFSQEARKVDEFGTIQCGDFMARMDAIFQESQKMPDSKIYVIYYGGRYKKASVQFNKKTQLFDAVQLYHPHREDGLAYAKSIPLYLTTYRSYPLETRNQLKDRITLIDGGYQEDLVMEIWFASPNAVPPKPTPLLSEKDVVFRNGKPRPTPNFTGCYDGY